MTTPNDNHPSRTDQAGIAFFILAGIGIIGWSAFATITRIVEVLRGDAVPVFAAFVHTQVDAPIGPGGTAVPVQLETASVTPEQLPLASVIAAVIEPVTALLTISTVIICLILLARNILRGRIFSKGNTKLVSTGSFTAIIGSALPPFFGNMVANGAIADISDGTFDNTLVLSIDFFPYVIGAFIAGLAVTVFSVGERLQRETEGLV